MELGKQIKYSESECYNKLVGLTHILPDDVPLTFIGIDLANRRNYNIRIGSFLFDIIENKQAVSWDVTVKSMKDIVIQPY